MDTANVESVCNLLSRSKLFVPDEIRSLRQRWQREAKENAADPGRFLKWLVTARYLTEYQADLVGRGRVDRFFLNEYKLLERIGVGAMAGVYKAVHRLGQVVAVKVLPPSKAKDSNCFARFQREARLARRLKHPNIVRTFEVGEDHGLHYLVMEYLEGETLEDAVKRLGKLPPSEAVRLIYQALLGLECLHEEGMVHRDLKPGNLMLVYPNPGGAPLASDSSRIVARATVKILDIGLGRALFDESDAPPGEDANLTADGTILGTIDYMAPEQARDSHAADIRSDVYSLGCTLFHALTGRPPFPDSNAVRKMLRHASEPVPKLTAFNPAVPEGLQQIVEWMMAKDPAQRYPTPQRAAQALQVFLVAGVEESPRESNEQLHAYLNWLETQHGENDIPTPQKKSEPVASPPAPRAGPAEPFVSSDVELVALQPKHATEPRLIRRDAIKIVAGVAGLAATAGAVWLLKRVLGKKPSPAEQP